MLLITSELILMSIYVYVAESINQLSTDCRTFGHVGLCQLRSKQRPHMTEKSYNHCH